MKFIKLSPEAFGAFTDKMPYSHFTQMKVNYDVKTAEGAEVHIIGVEENDEIIAAGLFTAVPVMKKFKYFYSNRGPVMDYSNEALVHFYFSGLRDYLKQFNALFVRIDPYVPLQMRDHDGNIIETYDGAALIKTLSNLGYIHQGYSTGFHPIHQIRFHSVLNLEGKNEQTVLKDMDSLRRRNIKKVLKNGVKVRFLQQDEMPLFRSFMADTSDMKDFVDRTDKFYADRLQHFGDRALMPLAYIDFPTYIPELEAEIVKIKKDITKAEQEIEKHPEAKKGHNKLSEAKKQLESTQEKLTEAQQLQMKHGDTLPVAAAFYLVNPFEMVYLAGGSANEFRHFAGSYAIQWEMIKRALSQGINRYNFYGISGDFSDTAEDAGVIKFKKGFNADVMEYVGDFVLPVNKPVYKIYSAMKQLKGGQ